MRAVLLGRPALGTALFITAAWLGGGPQPSRAQVAQTLNGPPVQMQPYVAEPGAPIITINPATPTPFGGLSGGAGSAGGTDTGPGGDIGGSATSVTSSDALNTMLATAWGVTAAANAQAVGVNPSALAATCLVESGCGANVGNGSGAQGVFQMYPAAFNEGLTTATAVSPALASQIIPGGAGMRDPITQGIAASGYLLQANQALQSAGVSSPTVLDARSYYEFGPRYGLAIAQADPTTLMSDLLPANFLSQNNISPTSTIAQWRVSVQNKIGTAASQTIQN